MPGTLERSLSILIAQKHRGLILGKGSDFFPFSAKSLFHFTSVSSSLRLDPTQLLSSYILQVPRYIFHSLLSSSHLYVRMYSTAASSFSSQLLDLLELYARISISNLHVCRENEGKKRSGDLLSLLALREKEEQL